MTEVSSSICMTDEARCNYSSGDDSIFGASHKHTVMMCRLLSHTGVIFMCLHVLMTYRKKLRIFGSERFCCWWSAVRCKTCGRQ